MELRSERLSRRAPNPGEGAGANSVRGWRRGALSDAAGQRGSALSEAAGNSQVSAIEKSSDKADEPRPTHTPASRALPDVHLPDTSPGQLRARRTSGQSRGRGGVGRSAGSVPRAVSGAPGAGAAPGGWVASGRAGAGAQGQERGAVRRKGSGAAFSPASGSAKWQQLEDGASFGRTPGPSFRRRRARRARLAGSRPAPGRLGPAGGSRGELRSGARPLRTARVYGPARTRSLARKRRLGDGAGPS